MVLTLVHHRKVHRPDARVTEIVMLCRVHHCIQGVQLEDVVGQVEIAIRPEAVQGHEVARVVSRVVCRVVFETKVLSKKCRPDHHIPIQLTRPLTFPPFVPSDIKMGSPSMAISGCITFLSHWIMISVRTGFSKLSNHWSNTIQSSRKWTCLLALMSSHCG